MATRVWTWLKANWKWLLFPVGLLLFVAGRWARPRPVPVVVSPALQKAAEEAARARAEADRRAAEAARVRDERVRQIEAEHAEALKKLTEGQRQQVEQLRGDPEELNRYLLELGRQMRG